MVTVVPSTDYIGIFHKKWTIVASETGLSECVVGLSATIGPNPTRGGHRLDKGGQKKRSQRKGPKGEGRKPILGTFEARLCQTSPAAPAIG